MAQMTTVSFRSPAFHSLRSAFRFGIREGRCCNQVDGVGALIPGDETFTDAGIHGAVGGAGLVRKAAEVGLDEAFLEVFARVPGHDFIALSIVVASQALRLDRKIRAISDNSHEGVSLPLAGLGVLRRRVAV